MRSLIPDLVDGQNAHSAVGHDSAQILQLGDGTCVSPAPCDGVVEHFAAAGTGSAYQAIAVESAPGFCFTRHEVNQPIKVLLVFLRSRILDDVDVDRSAPGFVSQGGVLDLVVHEENIAGFVYEWVLARQVLRRGAQLVLVIDEIIAKFPAVTPGNHAETPVLGTEWIQIDGGSHAEETLGGVGIVVPGRSAGVDNPFADRKDEIFPEELLEGIQNSRVVQEREKRIGVVVEEGNDLLPLPPSIEPRAMIFRSCCG